MKDEAYIGKIKSNTGKYEEKNIEKRILEPSCTSAFCRKTEKRMCSTFLDDDRQKIFRTFWDDMNWST